MSRPLIHIIPPKWERGTVRTPEVTFMPVLCGARVYVNFVPGEPMWCRPEVLEHAHENANLCQDCILGLLAATG